jgi:hypothetical protein
LPDQGRRKTKVSGIELPRLAVASGLAPLPGVLTLLNSPGDSWI